MFHHTPRAFGEFYVFESRAWTVGLKLNHLWRTSFFSDVRKFFPFLENAVAFLLSFEVYVVRTFNLLIVFCPLPGVTLGLI